MEEEKKELQAEEVKPEEPAQQSGGMTPQSKGALLSFIFAVVGFGFSCAWIAAFVGTVLGIVSLVLLKKNNPETEKQPFKTFAKIAKPVAIVDIILGAILFVIALIVMIVTAVAAAAAAANA